MTEEIKHCPNNHGIEEIITSSEGTSYCKKCEEDARKIMDSIRKQAEEEAKEIVKHLVENCHLDCCGGDYCEFPLNNEQQENASQDKIANALEKWMRKELFANSEVDSLAAENAVLREQNLALNTQEVKLQSKLDQATQALYGIANLGIVQSMENPMTLHGVVDLAKCVLREIEEGE